MTENESRQKGRNKTTSPGEVQPLLQVLVWEATRRGETLAKLAQHLGVTYEHFAQWRRNESQICNAHRNVHEKAARYLGWPTVLVLTMAGTVSLKDFVWPDADTVETRVTRELERLRQDPYFGSFVPSELELAAPAVRLFVTFLYRQIVIDPEREKSGYAWVRFMRNAAAGDVDSQLDLQGPRQTGPNAKSIF